MRQIGRVGSSAILAFASVLLASALFFSPLPAVAGKVIHPTLDAVAAQRAAGGATSGVTVARSGGAPILTAAITGPLFYRGSVAGVGVTTGAPQVYLVFWGTQWGTASTDGNGNTVLSGDTYNAMPLLQQFFKGLGTGGETWSGVMSRSCETLVNATTCPATAQHVGYPTGGALAGVWYDNSKAHPGTTNDNAIAQEALAAAAHFGNTTPAQNRNVQYVILSPPGTKPGGFNTPTAGWCAWHDWNGDTTMVGGAVTSPYGNFAFTNMPYVADLGASCGANYVNSGATGLTDGFTMVEGHEYAETVTDQFPAGGWTDATGYENSDKCSWIGTGGSGGSINITLPTGVFAVQGHWLNDVNGCSNGITPYSGTPNVITVNTGGTKLGSVSSAITPITLSASGSDTTISSYTFSATALPAGITLNGTTGVLSGTPTTTGNTTSWITAADPAGAVGYAPLAWTIAASAVTVTKPANQSTSIGVAVSLAATATTSNTGNTGFTWTATGLPTGIVINASTGVMSGTPTTARAATTVTLKATDSLGAFASNTFTWAIVNPVTVAKPANQSSSLGVSVSLTATATTSTAGNTGFTWSATGLPAGITMNATTGVMSGTPTTVRAAATVTLTARDSFGASNTNTFTWAITSPVTVAKPANQSSTIGLAVMLTPSATTTSAGNTGFTWAATGLPTGISINSSTGVMSGTPTTVRAAATVTLTATNSFGASASNTFTWAVVNTTVRVATIPNQTGTRNTAITPVTATATDNNPALTTFTWSATGLPPGLAINTATGVISGTISTAATVKTYTGIRVTARDANGASGNSATFTWAVN